MNGGPRTQYKRHVRVYHPSATGLQRRLIYEQAADAQITASPSADDAGIGALDVKIAELIGWPWVEEDIMLDWYAQHYPGTSVFFSPYPGAEPPPDPPDLPNPPILIDTLVGLHARADPVNIADWEFAEFRKVLGGNRPGVIKVLSGHPEAHVSRLAAENPGCRWIVRAFLDWGGRNVTPAEFYEWTRSDVDRTVAALKAQGVVEFDIVVELHNEPNLQAEGMWLSWQNGEEFGTFLFEVMKLYRINRPVITGCATGSSDGSILPPEFREWQQRFLQSWFRESSSLDGPSILRSGELSCDAPARSLRHGPAKSKYGVVGFCKALRA